MMTEDQKKKLIFIENTVHNLGILLQQFKALPSMPVPPISNHAIDSIYRHATNCGCRCDNIGKDKKHGE